MLKWDGVNPPTEFNPTFNTDSKMNPELYNRMLNLKILGNMLKVKKPVNSLLYIILGLAFGGFLVYYLIAMKFISI
jgi:hypothetical protein